jgi:hypothetical protein
LQQLPIFSDQYYTVAGFGGINEKYLNRMENFVFQPVWEAGNASRRGLKSKMKGTLNRLKEEFARSYGE